ncbi:MAG: hypothetical protein JO214_07365 [Frankiaceae bacterium]|nr:hypothetical protein [Frankiaceae bacterium]
MRRLAGGGTLLVAATTLVACAGGSGSARRDQAPISINGESSSPAHSDCGAVPTSTGPLARAAHLTITVPAAASGGEVLPVTATVLSTSPLPRMITTPATSAVLLARDGVVVGRAVGRPRPSIPLQLAGAGSKPAQAVPTSIRLVTCGPPNATTPLPAGQYDVVGVLGYQLDSLNQAPADSSGAPPTGGRSFVLVSAAASTTLN